MSPHVFTINSYAVKMGSLVIVASTSKQQPFSTPTATTTRTKEVAASVLKITLQNCSTSNNRPATDKHNQQLQQEQKKIISDISTTTTISFVSISLINATQPLYNSRMIIVQQIPGIWKHVAQQQTSKWLCNREQIIQHQCG